MIPVALQIVEKESPPEEEFRPNPNEFYTEEELLAFQNNKKTPPHKDHGDPELTSNTSSD